jgi:hypothetical protein
MTLTVHSPQIESTDTAQDLLQRFGEAVLLQFDINANDDEPITLKRDPFRSSLYSLVSWDLNKAKYVFESRFRSQDYAAIRKHIPDLPKDLNGGGLSLYWNARKAHGSPLYQFVAFYQVLEYFLAEYALSPTARSARVELKSLLAAGVADDEKVEESIRLAQRIRPKPEREQLSAAIRTWVKPDDLQEELKLGRDFWDSQDALDVEETLLSADEPDQRDQLARRLFGIRCRIVHTKSEVQVPPILPNSREEELLGFDLGLAEFVAQRALLYRERDVTDLG